MTIKAVLFDFDGTISTLRAGWEEVMVPYMKESISGDYLVSEKESEELDQVINFYINSSAGIQTIHQMKWLRAMTIEKGWNNEVMNEWEYKAEYNRRLLVKVKQRVDQLDKGELKAESYLMKGVYEMLTLLKERGLRLYVASGTDHPDVVKEAEVLGVSEFFDGIAGAPTGMVDCSKEKTIKHLLENLKFASSELAVVGDGKIEIGLAKEVGALAIGLASDEEKREGLNHVKDVRLRDARADWIASDYLNKADWIRVLFP